MAQHGHDSSRPASEIGGRRQVPAARRGELRQRLPFARLVAVAQALVWLGCGNSEPETSTEPNAPAASDNNSAAGASSEAQAGAGGTPPTSDATSPAAAGAGNGLACSALDQACSLDAACCPGLLCVTLTQNAEAISTCMQVCDTGEECDTGCCRPVGGTSVCLPRLACPEFCSEAGGPCGSADDFCCTGLACTAINDAPFTCRPACETDTDCSEACCEPVGDAFACLEAGVCPR